MPVTTPPTITPVPSPAPVRGDRTTFSGRVDAFVSWLSTAVAQFAAVATNVFGNATDAATSATTATTKASEALTSAGNASTSAGNAAASATASASSATSSASSAGTATAAVVTVTALKQDVIDAVNVAAVVEDWGLITEAVTATTDYGIF